MKNKLELTWFGKDKRINVEPRILLLDQEKSFGDMNNDNMLIHGDNLLCLKALEKDYSSKIKCIYIDPPYNTGSAFECYNDNLEHSIWLTLMRDRLEILRKLLSDDGLIFVQIDDNEQAYLKIMMDEIFGRNNFVNCICVKMSEASGVKMAHVDKRLPKLKEYILVYKKENIKLNEFKIDKPAWDSEYKTMITNLSKEEIVFVKNIMKKEDRSTNEIEKCRLIMDKAEYISISNYFSQNNITKEVEKNKFNFDNSYRIFQTVSMGSGTTQSINESRKIYCKNKFFVHITPKNKMYIIKGDYEIEKRKPRIQVLFADEYLKFNPGDLWTDIKTTGLDNEGAGVDFKNSKKPEMLIKRIIELCTSDGDLVLDSFLGSGTTAAVAHKMNRKWIGIEMGDHCYDLCKVRLDNVIKGEQSGISKSVNWNGGGGYKFYELAPTLINKDLFNEPIISSIYNPEMLANAVALHEGFKYEPNKEYFWKQSKGNEKSYLYVTTSFVSDNLLQKISEDLLEEEFLIIACTSYDENINNRYKNIIIKKIPEMLLNKCEYGVDNYNFNISNTNIEEEVE